MREAMHNLPAEQALLGAVMLRDTVLDVVDVHPGDFYLPPHGALWSGMVALHAKRSPVTMPALAGHFGADFSKLLDPLCEAIKSSVTADNAEHYAELIRTASLDRRIRELMGDMAASNETGESLLGLALERLAKLPTLRRDDSVAMPDLVRAEMGVLHALSVRKEAGEAIETGITTGLADLDTALGGGIQRGVVTIIAGRPSMGKSSLARQVTHAAVKAGFGAHLFSLEDRRGSYFQRMLSGLSGVPLTALRSVEWQRGQMSDLGRAANDLIALPRWRIDDATGLSASEIARRVRRHGVQHKPDLVVVDYVGLLTEPGASDFRTEVSRAARGLARLAREENVGLILVAQLNRENEKAGNRRPVLSDLKESGTLEEIADAVLFVHREDKAQPAAELLVRKNKNGEADGFVRLHFDGPTTTFRAVTTREEPVRATPRATTYRSREPGEDG